MTRLWLALVAGFFACGLHAQINNPTGPGPIQNPGTVTGGTGTGTGVQSLPSGVVIGNGTATATSGSYTDIARLYQTTTKSIGTRISSVFTEQSSGTVLNGTTPATNITGGTWAADANFKFATGGMSYSGTASAYALIDSGIADGTITWNTSGNTGASYLIFRYTDVNNFVRIGWLGNYIIVTSIEAGVSTQLYTDNGSWGSQMVVTLKGQSITFTSGSTSKSTTLSASSPNLTGTKIGMFSTGNATTVWTGLTAVGAITSTVACPTGSVMQTDGYCSPIAASNFIVADANGHAASLAEKQTQTDSLGNVTIACDEDLGQGKFDPRCAKYGNGGLLGSTPGQAMQDLSTALICYEGKTGKMPTVYFPPGNFKIGTPTNPTLQLPIGNYIGAGGRNGNGTRFLATYNNVGALTFNYGVSASCPDGTTQTANVQGGVVRGIGEQGCYAGACINKPGDSGTWPNGGPSQTGINFGDQKGRFYDISTKQNGSDGLYVNGQDSVLDGGFSEGDNRFFLDSLPFNTALYTFSANEKHGSIVVYGVDNQAYNIETYGSFLPGSGCVHGGTTGTGCNVSTEYGHIYAVLQGDQSNVNGFFLQVAELGIWLDGTHTKTVDGRIEAMYGVGVAGGGNGVVTGVTVSGACLDATAKTKSPLGNYDGGCFYFSIPNYDTSSIHAFSGNGFFGQDYPTADAYGGRLPGFSGTIADQDSRLPQGWGININKSYGYNYGPNVTADANGLVNVEFQNGITPADTVNVTYKGFSKKFDGQDIFITSGDAHVTLGGAGSGGSFINCNGGDLNLSQPGMLHYVVHYTSNTSYGSYQILQICGGPGGSETVVLQIPAPGTVSGTVSGTGGALAAATYYYKVTATTSAGETTASPEASFTTTGTTSSVALSWTAVTGATGYRVYRGTTAGGESVYYSTSSASYNDTGNASTAGTVPTTNTSGTTAPAFSVNVADSEVVLNQNVAFTIPAGSPGQPKVLTFCQNIVGGYAVTAPSNVVGFSAPSVTANACTPQQFTYSLTKAAWLASSSTSGGGGAYVPLSGGTMTGALNINDASGIGGGEDPTEGNPKTGAAGVDSWWADSTSHWLKMNNNNAGAQSIVGITTPGTAGNGVKLDANGKDIVDAGGPPVTAHNGVPTSVLSAGAGTGPSGSSFAAGSTDDAGWFSFTTGTTPTANAGAVTITYAGTYAAARRCMVGAGNPAAASAAFYVPSSQSTATSFVIFAGTPALTASTTYQIAYRCN